MTKIYCARWVLPILSGPLEGGAVAVEGSRIVGVGARAELSEKFPSAVVEDLGEAVILPGFINCHTHLELTAMRGFLEPEEGDFFAWLRRVTVARGEGMSDRGLVRLRRVGRGRGGARGRDLRRRREQRGRDHDARAARLGSARHRLSGGFRA